MAKKSPAGEGGTKNNRELSSTVVFWREGIFWMLKNGRIARHRYMKITDSFGCSIRLLFADEENSWKDSQNGDLPFRMLGPTKAFWNRFEESQDGNYFA